MSNLTTYEKLKFIRRYYMTSIGEITCYSSWSDPFKLENIMKVYEKLIKANPEHDLDKIDPSDLTKEEMELLDFGKMSKDNLEYLIPIWVYPFLKSEIRTIDINGEMKTINKLDIDTDHRYGNLAYGVFPKDLKFGDPNIKEN